VVAAGKRQALEMFPFIAVVVVVVKTYRMMVVVVIVMEMICIWSLLMRLLLPEQLSKAMSNRVQNLHLSGVLLSY